MLTMFSESTKWLTNKTFVHQFFWQLATTGSMISCQTGPEPTRGLKNVRLRVSRRWGRNRKMRWNMNIKTLNLWIELNWTIETWSVRSPLKKERPLSVEEWTDHGQRPRPDREERVDSQRSVHYWLEPKARDNVRGGERAAKYLETNPTITVTQNDPNYAEKSQSLQTSHRLISSSRQSFPIVLHRKRLQNSIAVPTEQPMIGWADHWQHYQRRQVESWKTFD